MGAFSIFSTCASVLFSSFSPEKYATQMQMILFLLAADDTGWLIVNLCLWLSRKKRKTFSFLLLSFSSFYCGPPSCSLQTTDLIFLHFVMASENTHFRNIFKQQKKTGLSCKISRCLPLYQIVYGSKTICQIKMRQAGARVPTSLAFKN